MKSQNGSVLGILRVVHFPVLVINTGLIDILVEFAGARLSAAHLNSLKAVYVDFRATRPEPLVVLRCKGSSAQLIV